MSTRLKVFVSSTMRDDLENERDLVCRGLRDLNFEPVNAESWGPDGTQTWERIRDEIRDSHIFLLLIGKRYGWIPTAGAHAGERRSVTHLEYLEARKNDLPILPFLKELDYDTDRTSDDAQARDTFRKEVSDWAQGEYIGKFRLASDLAASVVKSLIVMLSSEWVQTRIRAQVVSAAAPPAPPATAHRVPVLPPPLVDAVHRRDAVLFTGAGMSLAAGLPSAVAFAQRMAYEIEREEPGYGISPSAAVFAGTATDLILLKGRRSLVSQLHDLMNPPQGLEPSSAHKVAVQLFETIVTTNYDDLFERAANDAGAGLTVIEGELTAPSLPPKTILKFHGSWLRPDSLIITESDILLLDQTHPCLWRALLDIIRTRVVVTVGLSLRDPSIVRLFTEARSTVRGYAVQPGSFRLRDARLNALNLQPVDSDADSFFGELTRRTQQPA